jgi:NAD(P)-dependent dehydrogenase (short-subunit alcohol dehydrogenase family)
MGKLDGRVAVVTGAGTGLGRQEALLLAAEGAKVVVNDLKGAQNTVDEIVAAGGQAVAVEGGVSDVKVGQAMVDAAVETFGGLHAIVNNAGFIRDALLVKMTEEQFDQVIDVHLKGTFALTRAAATYWVEQAKAGSTEVRNIVNTTSGAGLHGNPGQFNYSAAKAGAAMMVITAAAELKKFNVRANAIAPVAGTAPVLATPGLGEGIAKAKEANNGWDKFDPANIAPLAAYLTTADCPFTGQVFSVFGGHVGLYQGWSIAHEIDHGATWTVDELTSALAAWPTHVKVNRQRITF